MEFLILGPVEVLDHEGRPLEVPRGRSREIGLGKGGSRMLLSLTHDGDYALAQAMLVDD